MCHAGCTVQFHMGPCKLWSLLMGREMLTNRDMWHVTLKRGLWFGHGDKTLNCGAGPQSAAVKCSVCTKRNNINWQASTQHSPDGKQTMHVRLQCNNNELCLLLCGLTCIASLSRHIITYVSYACLQIYLITICVVETSMWHCVGAAALNKALLQ